MTLSFVAVPRHAWTTIFRTPDAPRAVARPETLEKPDSAPLSDEDRAYLEHRFLRDWMIENPEALQSEGGAMLLRTLFQNRF